MGTKILHGKITGYDGEYKEKNYPTHLNGQGVSIFGAAHDSNSPASYSAHHNACGVSVFGPERSKTVKTHYPHVKIAYKRESLRTPNATGGQVKRGTFGKLVGRS